MGRNLAGAAGDIFARLSFAFFARSRRRLSASPYLAGRCAVAAIARSVGGRPA